MRHIALLCEYDGSVFHGWQEQANAPSVQEALRLAWRELSGEDFSFRSCSRTDAGVSAWAHVSDFFTESAIPAEKIPLALNSKVPSGLSVLKAREVPEAFHSRKNPLGKAYVYRVWLGPSRPSILRHLVAHFPLDLNLQSMNELGQQLCGEHDFKAFMDQGSVVRQTIRRLDCLLSVRQGDTLAIICLGDGFLYHQVRILAGTLILVGRQKLSLEEVLDACHRKDRTALGPTLPPEGLCLHKVFFPGGLFGDDDENAYKALCHSAALFKPLDFSLEKSR